MDVILRISMQQTFFGKNDGKDALSSPSRSNHVDVMRWVDCLRMFLGFYLQSYVFRRILKDMFWWSLSTKFAQRKNKQALAGYTYIYICILCSKHISWYHVEKQEKVMRQCTRLKLSSLKYEAKQGNHALWAVMRPGCRIFAATCAFILLHAERKAKSKVFHFTTNFEY